MSVWQRYYSKDDGILGPEGNFEVQSSICVCVYVCVCVCVCVFFVFLGHMEVPRLGVESEL